jgi:TRAP-type mannitol/chloroaromatic compound transport system permease small subunit
MWPIKLMMTAGMFLMLLQCISELFKDVLRIRGEEI